MRARSFANIAADWKTCVASLIWISRALVEISVFETLSLCLLRKQTHGIFQRHSFEEHTQHTIPERPIIPISRKKGDASREKNKKKKEEEGATRSISLLSRAQIGISLCIYMLSSPLYIYTCIIRRERDKIPRRRLHLINTSTWALPGGFRLLKTFPAATPWESEPEKKKDGESRYPSVNLVYIYIYFFGAFFSPREHVYYTWRCLSVGRIAW